METMGTIIQSGPDNVAPLSLERLLGSAQLFLPLALLVVHTALLFPMSVPVLVKDQLIIGVFGIPLLNLLVVAFP